MAPVQHLLLGLFRMAVHDHILRCRYCSRPKGCSPTLDAIGSARRVDVRAGIGPHELVELSAVMRFRYRVPNLQDRATILLIQHQHMDGNEPISGSAVATYNGLIDGQKRTKEQRDRSD